MPSSANRIAVVSALVACGMALASSGCRKNNVHAAPPVTTAPAPVEVKPATAPPAETKPAPVPETPPPATPAPQPAKPAPHRSPEKPPVEPEPAPPTPKPPAPQMSPQLSPQDVAEYQKRTNEDIGAAEKDLQQTDGRSLNASQHDLVEKIRSFLGQSREAGRASDWVRARNLAQKAHVLSIELVNSL